MSAYATSREWEIDQRVKVIISKMVDGTATESEVSEMHLLTAERAKRMMPVFKGQTR